MTGRGTAAGLVKPGFPVPKTVVSGTTATGGVPPQVSPSRKLVPKRRVATPVGYGM